MNTVVNYKLKKIWKENLFQGSCHLPCFKVHEYSSFLNAQVGDAKPQTPRLLLTIAPSWQHIFCAPW